MPLSSAAPSLETDIRSAYQTAQGDGSSGNKTSDIIITELALGIATAIHSYSLQALVTTQDTSDAGQTDIPGTGVTSVEGKGTGTGNLL
jgi:hypothetical protein